MHNIIIVKNGGTHMREFKSEASLLAWKLFLKTGKIGFYLLHANIENHPYKDLIEDNEFQS